jgi:hypothetical protein
MLIALGNEVPLVHLNRASHIINSFLRTVILKRTSVQPLWRIFEFWTRRIVRCRAKLKRLILKWVARRRREIDECVERWTRIERDAHTYLRFIEYLAMWVAPEKKRSVVVLFRRECCHLYLANLSGYLQRQKEMEDSFFETALQTRATGLRTYRIAKALIFHLLAGSNRETRFLFYKANIYSLIAVMARHRYPDIPAHDSERAVRTWISECRLQHSDDLPDEPFVVCKHLRRITSQPMFPELQHIFAEKLSNFGKTRFFDNIMILASSVSPGHAGAGHGGSDLRSPRSRSPSSPESAFKARQRTRQVQVVSPSHNRLDGSLIDVLTTPNGKSEFDLSSSHLTVPGVGSASGSSAQHHGSRRPMIKSQHHSLTFVGDSWLEKGEWDGVMSATVKPKPPNPAEARAAFRAFVHEEHQRSLKLVGKGNAVQAQALRGTRQRRNELSAFTKWRHSQYLVSDKEGRSPSEAKDRGSDSPVQLTSTPAPSSSRPPSSTSLASTLVRRVKKNLISQVQPGTLATDQLAQRAQAWTDALDMLRARSSESPAGPQLTSADLLGRCPDTFQVQFSVGSVHLHSRDHREGWPLPFREWMNKVADAYEQKNPSPPPAPRGGKLHHSRLREGRTTTSTPRGPNP